MTKKYEIVLKYVKDLSVEIPNPDTFIFSREYITKYSLGINITTNPLKNEMIEIIENISGSKIEKNYPSETSNRFSFDDGKGEIGFISSISNPFCDNCTRARITADGKLVTCLFANKGMNLKSMLRSKKSNEYITSEIINMWKLRDDKYSLERSTSKIKVKNKIEMFQTGG